MSDCNVCKKAVATTRQNSSIVCSDCKKLCHGSCVNMNKEDVECIVSQNQAWRCPPCTRLRRSSMSSTPDKQGKPDIAQVISLLKEAKDERKRIEVDMNKAFDFVHKQIDDQKVILSDQAKKFSDLIQMLEDLQEENKYLKSKVKDLECRLDDSEQYSRANTVEIHNIPELPSEDTYEIVSKVGVALDLDISRDMIDVCHRLGKREDSGRPAAIIVRFVRREVKQNMLVKRRARKRDFTTKHVGYQTSDPKIVYVNESLCPGRRRVYAAAREAQRSKGYKFLWIRNGRILMRRDENAPVKALYSLDDVDCL